MEAKTLTRRLIATPEAAEYLGTTEATLEKFRWQHRGPDFVLLGRAVRYDIADLDKWIAENRQQPASRERDTHADLT